MNNKKFRQILYFVLVAIFFTNFGYFLATKKIGFTIQDFTPQVKITNQAPVNQNVDFSLFWDVWNRLEQKYIDKSKLNPQQMVWGAIKGMVASLDDPYTVFLPPKENTQSKEDLSGEFEGIGAQLGMKNKRIVIIAPIAGSPAEQMGLKPGDWIMKVDGKDTGGWTVNDAVDKIRGPKNTKVVLTILRASDLAKLEESTDISGSIKPVEISITRAKISVPSVTLEYKGDIAVLKIAVFGDTTTEEWQKFIAQIVREGKAKKIVLDLRNNPGGYLQSAVFVASEFLDGGTVVIQQNYDGTKDEMKVMRNGYLTTQPMVVLVNEGSASASEIVSGALKVRGRATLVGKKTFGKGSVQEPEELAGGAGLHVTIAKWLLPDGSWINGTGIKPNVDFADNPDTKNDEQLDKAVEILNKK